MNKIEKEKEEKEEEGEVGKNVDFPDAKKDTTSDVSTPEQSDLERVRIAALMEYGINGAVDPKVVAAKLKLNPDTVVILIAQLGYEPHTRPDGTCIFKQPSNIPKEAKA
ncbi:MAG: hypothetical protein ABR985_17195 [Methanotrichaceae archaeon]|jgi:hypothetical protein